MQYAYRWWAYFCYDGSIHWLWHVERHEIAVTLHFDVQMYEITSTSSPSAHHPSSTPEPTAFSSIATFTTVCGTIEQCPTPAACMGLGKSGLSQPDDSPKSPYPTTSDDNAIRHIVGGLIAGCLATAVIGFLCATLVCSWRKCRSRSRCSQECDGLTKHKIEPFTTGTNTVKGDKRSRIYRTWPRTSEEMRIQDTSTTTRREHRTPPLEHRSARNSTRNTQSAEIGSTIAHHPDTYYVHERFSIAHDGDIAGTFASSVQSESAPVSYPALISSGITHIVIKGEQSNRSKGNLNLINVEEPPPVYQLNANRLTL